MLTVVERDSEDARALVESGAGRPVQLERGRRLSASLLWAVQRAFFLRHGASAWSTGHVPHYITNNPSIAQAYADIVAAYVHDQRCCGIVYTQEDPLFIVELGSGSGRFAHQFLMRLQLLSPGTADGQLPVRYVMTDFNRDLLAHWQQHPALGALLSKGLLDCAVFDAGQPSDLHLARSRTLLCRDAVAHPMVVIANYFFDSIPADCFTIKDGRLYESLVTTSSSSTDPTLGNPELLQSLDLAFEDHPADADYYPEPELNRILRRYQERLGDTTVLFPTAALRCIDHFRELSSGRLLVLTADRGCDREEELLQREPPQLALHGSFSLTVNYHALGEYVRGAQGLALHPPHQPAQLTLAAYLFGDAERHRATVRSYRQVMTERSPDDFFSLKTALEPHYQDLTAIQMLAYLRLSGFDGDLFLGCFPYLLEKVRSASGPLRSQTAALVRRIWATHYPLTDESDMAFCLGTLLCAMGYYGEALEYLECSIEAYGPNPQRLYNVALCCYRLRDWDRARDAVGQALESAPEFSKARDLSIAIEGALESTRTPYGGTVNP